MTLPPLYKYLDVTGAKRTLGNRTFLHAKPSSYDDLEEVTVRDIFPVDVEQALTKVRDGCIDVILANLDEPPTCSPQLKKAVAELQSIFKADPAVADAVREQLKENPIFDIEDARAEAQGLVDWIHEYMQGYRILCVTTDKTSERMWEDYAQDHEGIALRIESNQARDSKFGLFRPVQYRAARPALYDETLDFLKGCWFGDQKDRTRTMIDKIIYSKTLQYKFEKEYRLAIPVGDGGDWSTLPFQPEEISELYLGLAIEQQNKKEVVTLAKAINPQIAIFQMDRDSSKKMAVNRL